MLNSGSEYLQELKEKCSLVAKKFIKNLEEYKDNRENLPTEENGIAILLEG